MKNNKLIIRLAEHNLSSPGRIFGNLRAKNAMYERAGVCLLSFSFIGYRQRPLV
jgi:hypothetical protein